MLFRKKKVIKEKSLTIFEIFIHNSFTKKMKIWHIRQNK